VVLVRCRSGNRGGALSEVAGRTLAAAVTEACAVRLPLVIVLASGGADVAEGINALHGWGLAAAAVARCSGRVPVLMAVTGPALSGQALLLGLADVRHPRCRLHRLSHAALQARSAGRPQARLDAQLALAASRPLPGPRCGWTPYERYGRM